MVALGQMGGTMAEDLELVLTDEAVLLPLTYALKLGWVAAPCPVRWVSAAEAETAAGAPAAVTLASPLAAAQAATTHALMADVAVASRFRGTQALASTRRPDELAAVEIDARDVTATTEALTRILAAQHFGARDWALTRTPAPGATARLLEGDAALIALAEAEATLDESSRYGSGVETEDEAAADGDDQAASAPPAGGPGHVEDLARAWFVLTGLPWVSHVLVAPQALATARPADLAAVVAALQEALRMGREQQAAVVAEAAARLGVPTGTVRALFEARSYTLGVEERRTLDRLFERGARFAGLPPAPALTIVEMGSRQ